MLGSKPSGCGEILGGASPKAGDDPDAVHAAEVAVDKSALGLRAVGGALGEREVPRGVLVPRVPRQLGVLVLGGGLNAAPLAAQHVLAGLTLGPERNFPGMQLIPGIGVSPAGPRTPKNRQDRILRRGSGR